MKTKHIIYPVSIMIMIIIPAIRYYTTTPEVNWCVIDYVDEINNGNFEWYLYNIKWQRHIEPKNSSLNPSLEQYKIWVANWCIMSSDNFYVDIVNTFYCSFTYLLKNSPIPEWLKEPFWVYKWWEINID